MEIELVACLETTIHVLWLWNHISGLGIGDTSTKPTKICFDNSASVFFSKKMENTRKVQNTWNKSILSLKRRFKNNEYSFGILELNHGKRDFVEKIGPKTMYGTCT